MKRAITFPGILLITIFIITQLSCNKETPLQSYAGTYVGIDTLYQGCTSGCPYIFPDTVVVAPGIGNNSLTIISPNTGTLSATVNGHNLGITSDDDYNASGSGTLNGNHIYISWLSANSFNVSYINKNSSFTGNRQ